MDNGDVGGTWKVSSGKHWTQSNSSGNYYWVETHRDYNSVYLDDNSGRENLSARIDLYYKEVFLCNYALGSECYSFGPISKMQFEVSI